PPAAELEDLAGRFVVAEDSVWFRDVRLALATSRLAAEGAFAPETGSLRVGVTAAPIELADLQWIDPELPDSGGGSAQVALARQGERTMVRATGIDLRLQGARLVGHAGVEMGDSL